MRGWTLTHVQASDRLVLTLATGLGVRPDADSVAISDLKPNIGLAWYFFIEMFDHFRAFFLVVFALHPLIYIAPFTIAYRCVCHRRSRLRGLSHDRCFFCLYP